MDYCNFYNACGAIFVQRGMFLSKHNFSLNFFVSKFQESTVMLAAPLSCTQAGQCCDKIIFVYQLFTLRYAEFKNTFFSSVFLDSKQVFSKNMSTHFSCFCWQSVEKLSLHQNHLKSSTQNSQQLFVELSKFAPFFYKDTESCLLSGVLCPVCSE